MRSACSQPSACCRPVDLPTSCSSAAKFTTIWPSIDEGTAGTFVGYKVDDYLIIASDKDRSGEAKLPASTFKIPSSLIALETGVVQDLDKDVFKWDGVTRSIEAWNRDHTMRTAIAASAVPVYQEIARSDGGDRQLRDGRDAAVGLRANRAAGQGTAVQAGGGVGAPIGISSCPGKSAKRVFALDVPGIHVFPGARSKDVDGRSSRP